MGASLVSFIVKVPNKFADVTVAAAKAHAAKMSDLISSLNAALYEAKGDFDADSVQAKMREIVPLIDLPRIGVASDDTEEIVSVLEGCDVGEHIVDDLVNLVGDAPSDIGWRSDPHNPAFYIVVAGDTTWGEEPEGEGYQTLKTGFFFGLCGMLGIV